ncbi:hypothetical protein KI387_037130, partial [Taxus chinensis]
MEIITMSRGVKGSEEKDVHINGSAIKKEVEEKQGVPLRANVVKTLKENVDFLLNSTIKEQALDPNAGLKDEIVALETKFKNLEDKYNNFLAMHNDIMELMQIEDYLYQRDLYLPLDEKSRPTKMTDEEWNILDRKALGSIRLSLAASVASNITEDDSTVDLMKSLANLYEKPSASNKVYLMKKLFSSKMHEESKGRKKERSKSKSNGKLKSRDSRSKSRSKGITCWKCRKKGHVKKDCWSKDKENQQPEKGKEVNLASSEQKRVIFLKVGATKKEKKLELVHSDVWGPTQVASHEGSSYYVTFINDATRKAWVYCIQSKYDVFETFKRWKSLVENESNSKLKFLRSNNGGEYCSKDFNDYCSVNGICRERMVPRTSQENGVAERMNMTIMECDRSMRIHSRLPLHFWAKAVNIAVYLINHGPSSSLDGGIPEETWTGKEVDLSFLKVFGLEAFVHVDRENRKKFDAKSKRCTFIGYGSGDFGFYFWDLENSKITRSRDVEWNEKIIYKDQILVPKDEKLRSLLMKMNSRVLKKHLQKYIVTVEAQIEPPVPQTPVRRSQRVSKLPERFTPSLFYLFLTHSGELKSFEEVMQDKTRVQWEHDMDEEMDSLEHNQTWDLVKLPAGKRTLQNKWVYRIKEEEGGHKRYKERLVVKGFAQKVGIDFGEIFSPVVKMTSIRTVLSLVAVVYLNLEKLDVKMAFLNGDLDEEIYMQHPLGYEVKGKEKLVCRLKKSLYGLKQAPRQWYMRFDSFMHEHGYLRCESDHCVYFKKLENGSYIILLLYVDDMLIAGSKGCGFVYLEAEYVVATEANKEMIWMNSWDNLVMVVSNTTFATNIFKFDDMIGIILNEEIHRKSIGESSSGNALNVESRGRQKEKYKSKNNGRSKSKNGRSKSRGRGITCWNCGKKGHAKKDCWFEENKENVPKKGKEENVASSEVMQDSLILSLDNKIEYLVLDSDSDASMWHNQLGHIIKKGMQILKEKGKLSDLKDVDLDFCEYCIFGKQKKVSFLKGSLAVRKHFDDTEGMEASSVKMVYSKRNHTNGDASTMSHNREFFEDRNNNGEGHMNGEVSPSCEASRVNNPPHPRPKSGKTKLKENGPKPNSRRGCGKSAADATDVGGRIQKHRQPNSKENHGSNLRHLKEVASDHNHKETRLDQPMRKRRQKQTPKAASERGKYQGSSVMKRNTEPETLPPSNQPNGKGMKRSRRVAQRLAPEEPPAPPLKLPRLNVVLTRKEIQEDWLQMTGHKYAGKPKKSTLIQKGLGLCTALTSPSSIEYLNEPP